MVLLSSIKPATHLAILYADRGPTTCRIALKLCGDIRMYDLYNGSSSRDNSLTKFSKTPCVSRLNIHVLDHIFLFSHFAERFLERLSSKTMAAASKCFRLAVAILVVYISFAQFFKRLSMEPGNKLEVPHRRDRRKKSPSVSASNSPRSAYKIARCVAGFSFLVILSKYYLFLY